MQEIGEEFDLDESFERPEEELSETQTDAVNSVAPVNVQSTPIATPTESHRNVARFVTPTNPPSTPAATRTFHLWMHIFLLEVVFLQMCN